MTFRDEDTEDIWFAERENPADFLSRQRTFKPHLSHFSSLRKLSQRSQEKLNRIKELVEKGWYETEEKIRVTARRILDVLLKD